MPRFFSPRRVRLFLALLIISLAQVAAAIMVARATSRLFRALSAGHDFARQDLILLLTMVVVASGLEYLKRCASEAVGLDFARDVRLLLLDRLLRSAFGQGKKRSQGGNLLPFVGDLTALRLWWADGVARGLSALIIIAAINIYLALQSGPLALGVLAVELVTIAAFLLLSVPMFGAIRDLRNRRGGMTGMISDRVEAAHSIYAHGGLERERKRIDRRNDQMNAAAMRRAHYSGLVRALAGAAASATVIAPLLLTREMILTGGAEPHAIVGLISIAALIGSSLSDLGRATELFIPGRISMRLIRSRLNEGVVLSPADMAGRDPTERRLVLDKLAAGSSDAPFSAHAQRGDIIRIDGAEGGGKTALISILAGLQPPVSGEVRFQGWPTSQIPQKRRRRIGLAAPYLPFLRGSLRMNLSYRLGRDDDGDLPELLTGFDLSEYLTPEGCIADFKISGHKQQFGKGTWQALGLVRAMAGMPPLLILDEMDGHLTGPQRAFLCARIRQWQGVVIFAAQSPELADLANRIWTIGPDGIREEASDRTNRKPDIRVVKVGNNDAV